MSCYSPLVGFFAATVNASGKRSLQFKPQGSFSGKPVRVPCGKCIGCRLEYSRAWAVRLMHEARMHKTSVFVTLTYNADNLPAFGTLVPRDLQLFHKRLHNRLLEKRGVGIRYYACGEYGDMNKRPHYHSIIFGYDFEDKLLYSRNARGEPIYTSEKLDEIWGLGECKIGAVTFESCAYVARYVTKKVDGKKREEGHYLVYNADGVISERVPEFSHMSRNPGIAAEYFAKYGNEVMTHDSVIMDGKEVPSVRYYDKKIEECKAERAAELKKLRFRKRNWKELQKERMRVKEALVLKRLKMKERRL